MKLLIILFVGTLSLSAFSASAQAQLINGDTMNTTDLVEILSGVRPGDVFIIGENHGFKTHQEQQMQIIKGLQSRGLQVSVGMEFLDITQQKMTDDFRSGVTSEADFLKEVKWGSPSFDYYREQILAPVVSRGETTIALNSPRSLTSVISKLGLAGLNSEQLKLLPPDFQLGRDSYKLRFEQTMGGHVPAEALNRYFTAQSVWDDTMAFTATEFLKLNPQQVLVIIVGEFHVQYGGGLPNRIEERGVPRSRIHTLSQFNTDGLTSAEEQEGTQPSVDFGPRAQWIWSAVAVP